MQVVWYKWILLRMPAWLHWRTKMSMVTITPIIVHVILYRSIRCVRYCLYNFLPHYKRCIDNDKPSNLCILPLGIHNLAVHNPSTTHEIISNGLTVIDHFKNSHWYRSLWNILQKTGQFPHRSQWWRIFVRTRKVVTKIIQAWKVIE